MGALETSTASSSRLEATKRRRWRRRRATGTPSGRGGCRPTWRRRRYACSTLRARRTAENAADALVRRLKRRWRRRRRPGGRGPKAVRRRSRLARGRSGTSPAGAVLREPRTDGRCPFVSDAKIMEGRARRPRVDQKMLAEEYHAATVASTRGAPDRREPLDKARCASVQLATEVDAGAASRRRLGCIILSYVFAAPRELRRPHRREAPRARTGASSHVRHTPHSAGSASGPHAPHAHAPPAGAFAQASREGCPSRARRRSSAARAGGGVPSGGARGIRASAACVSASAPPSARPLARVAAMASSSLQVDPRSRMSARPRRRARAVLAARAFALQSNAAHSRVSCEHNPEVGVQRSRSRRCA